MVGVPGPVELLILAALGVAVVVVIVLVLLLVNPKTRVVGMVVLVLFLGVFGAAVVAAGVLWAVTSRVVVPSSPATEPPPNETRQATLDVGPYRAKLEYDADNFNAALCYSWSNRVSLEVASIDGDLGAGINFHTGF